MGVEWVCVCVWMWSSICCLLWFISNIEEIEEMEEKIQQQQCTGNRVHWHFENCCWITQWHYSLDSTIVRFTCIGDSKLAMRLWRIQLCKQWKFYYEFIDSCIFFAVSHRRKNGKHKRIKIKFRNTGDSRAPPWL